MRKILIILTIISLCACQHEETHNTSVMFGSEEDSIDGGGDLAQIEASGELIAATLSGPDTYFEYRGQGFGLQYTLANNFAQSIGAKLRMEVAHDTIELIQKLNDGEVDMVALPITEQQLQHLPDSIDISGIESLSKGNNWLISKESTELSSSITRWYRPDLLAQLQKHEREMATRSHTVHRRARPVMLNAAKGQISQYDALLQKYSRGIGWDWRLLAAQCYQESAFDPHAVSWAGAQGLMQIMPGTARQMGVHHGSIYDPETNIAAGVRYLQLLNGKFSDIPDARERISFILAAYNGGAGHVRDAMALARQHGGNPHLWREVSPWILHLSEPRYYRSSAVQFGYMRGSETEGYVRSIQDRWAQYCGQARSYSSGSMPIPATHGKYSKHRNHIKSREELMIDSI